MSSLNNNFINKTFNSLLKLINNDPLTGTTKQTISDGSGNPLPISISPTEININGSLTTNTISVGSGNTSTNNSSVLGGVNNTATGQYSGILNGQNNYTDKPNSFIIGTNITATTENTTFVNNINIDGFLYDATSSSGNTGQLLSVGLNGISWITVNTSSITGDTINKQTFYNYTADTQNKIDSKLELSSFYLYTANTQNKIDSKLNSIDFYLYTADTQNKLDSKLNLSSFYLYTADTQNKLDSKLNLSSFYLYTSSTLTYINNTSSASTIYNSSLTPLLSMPSSVGGISVGTTVSQLTGLTFSKIFDDLFFPTSFPTYTIPTITIGGVSNTTSEVGSTITPTISVNAVKNDAGAYTLLRILRNGSSIYSSSPTASWTTAVPDQFGLTNPNSPNSGFTITPYSENYVIAAPSIGGTSSSTIYKADGNYNIGLAKPTNKNVTDTRSFAVRSTSAPQSPSNNFESLSYTYTGIYPYFYGTSASLPTAATIVNAISGGTATKVLSSASGTISIPYNTSGNYIWVAYFNNYTTKTKWYVNALDNGNIDNGFITTAVSQIVKSPDNYWNGVLYKLHWSVNQTIQTTLEFRNN